MSSRSPVAHLLDAYEAAIRRSSDAQRRLAGRVPFAPARTLLRLSADLTRDIGAAQLSGARWLLDA